MAFDSVRQLVDAEDGSGKRVSTWRKAPTQATGAGFWFDLSMSPGNPVPNYYAASPMIATRLAQSTDGGLFHGGPVAPKQKVLRRFCALTPTATAVPLPIVLCDYLLYYPFVDQSVTDPQFFDNTVVLPRYASGQGVQIMAVVVAGQTGGQTFQLSYTNSSGVAGRVTPTVTMCTQPINGTLITSAPATAGTCGPFIPLQNGDTGVRSIDSITFNGSDVGLFTLVLVQPIASASIRGIDAPVEIDYFKDFGAHPAIQDDAYLNAICLPAGSLSGAALHGFLETTWQ